MFEALFDAHCRFYQHFASSSVVMAIASFVAVAKVQPADTQLPEWLFAFVVTESLFLVTLRDILQHDYRRASRLLGEVERKEVKHVERTQEAKPTKPANPKPDRPSVAGK